MSFANRTERIDPDLKGLIPRFKENSQKDLEQIRAYLRDRDFINVSRIGHSLKGAGLGFGFSGISEIGIAIEKAADGGDVSTLEGLLDSFQEYLDTVTVVFNENKA